MSTDLQAIHANAVESLRSARMGLADFLARDPRRRITGFRNAVVFGRAVTNILEHLRGKVENFDEWYKPRSSALGSDPGFARLYKMRSEILKEGTGAPSQSIYIEHLNTADLQPLMQNPPRGAKGFFIGDQAGGSGWEVDLGDGETEKYYVALPPSVRMTTSFSLGDEDAGALLTRYLDALGDLLKDAKDHFGIGR